MLLSLNVKDYRLIENVSIDFSPRFNTITGETGSGKSMLLSSLMCLSDIKSDPTSVRQGAEKAIISATFDAHNLQNDVKEALENAGVELEDDTLIATKIIRRDSRTTASINGVSVPLKLLRDVVLSLVNFSSQREQNTLLKESAGVELLDSFASLSTLSDEVKRDANTLKKLQREIDNINEARRKTSEEKDYLELVKNEIEKAKVKPGEDDEIKASLKRAKQSFLYTTTLNEALDNLYKKEINASSLLSDALKSITHLQSKTDDDFSPLLTFLESAEITIKDAVEDIKSRLNTIVLDEDEIDALNDRDAILNRLKHKYGGTIESVLERYDDVKSRLDGLTTSDDQIERLEKEYKSLYKKYADKKHTLYNKRKESAVLLSKNTEDILHTLEMPNASFSISVEEGGDFDGDKVTLLFSANKGEAMQSASKVSSGGELSRLFLSLLSSSPNMLKGNTIVFDEIDSGLGGKTALRVRDYLLGLSEKLEVITITHQATIASSSNSHILMNKSVKGERSVIDASVIDGVEREREIARLLSGDVNQEALELSKKLLS